MDRFPQCHNCTRNKDGICKKNNKPVKAESMVFGRCKFAKFVKED